MSDLTKWILDNSESTNLQITEFSWPKTWGVPLHDIGVEITHNDKICRGRGKSRNHDIAFLKAMSECIERAAFNGSNLPNTSGMAAHPDKNQVKENAVLELIERDLFLCHYYMLSHLENMSAKVFSKDAMIKKIAEQLSKEEGVELVFAPLYGYDDIFCTICIAFGSNFKKKPFGIIMGLGCNKNEPDSYHSAFYECVAALSYYILDNQEESLSPLHTDSSNPQRPEDHRRCGYHSASAEVFRYLLSDKSRAPSGRKLSFSEIAKSTQIKKYVLSTPLQGVPLHIVSAKNEGLQNFLFGKTITDNINFNRLNSFVGKDFFAKDINYLTIPIG